MKKFLQRFLIFCALGLPAQASALTTTEALSAKFNLKNELLYTYSNMRVSPSPEKEECQHQLKILEPLVLEKNATGQDIQKLALRMLEYAIIGIFLDKGPNGAIKQEGEFWNYFVKSCYFLELVGEKQKETPNEAIWEKLGTKLLSWLEDHVKDNIKRYIYEAAGEPNGIIEVEAFPQMDTLLASFNDSYPISPGHVFSRAWRGICSLDKDDIIDCHYAEGGENYLSFKAKITSEAMVVMEDDGFAKTAAKVGIRDFHREFRLEKTDPNN